MNNKELIHTLRKDMNTPTPDVWDKIKDAPLLRCQPKKASSKSKRNPFVFVAPLATAAVVALVIGFSGNFFTNNLPDVKTTDEPQSQSTSGFEVIKEHTDASVSQPLVSDANASNQNPSQVYFNEGFGGSLKIKADVVTVTQNEWNQYFKINALNYPFDSFTLLYEKGGEGQPWGGTAGYSEDNRSLIVCLANQETRDFGIEDYTSAKIENTDVYFGYIALNTPTEELLYASYRLDNTNYSIEANGFTREELVEIVRMIIS